MFGLVGMGTENSKDKVGSCCGNAMSLCSGYSYATLVISIF